MGLDVGREMIKLIMKWRPNIGQDGVCAGEGLGGAGPLAGDIWVET